MRAFSSRATVALRPGMVAMPLTWDSVTVAASACENGHRNEKGSPS